jgi:hypothetical protein
MTHWCLFDWAGRRAVSAINDPFEERTVRHVTLKQNAVSRIFLHEVGAAARA